MFYIFLGCHFFLHRRPWVGVSIPTGPEHPDEQNDTDAAQLSRHDARHAGQHARDDGAGQAVLHGLQAPAHHTPGPAPAAAATG